MSLSNIPIRLMAFILVVLSVSVCTEGDRAVGPAFTDPLLIELTEIEGKYSWNNELNRYVFSEKPAVEKILATRNPELVVKALVGCMDNLEPSSSVIGEKSVPLGVICYEALSQTVYYEPATTGGDIAEKWPGHIQPTAAEKELREAKRAWKKVLDLNAYIFL